MKTMNIGLNVSRSFLKYAYVLLQSIFDHHRDFFVDIYIFSGNAEEIDLSDIKALASSHNGAIHLMKVDESLIKRVFQKPIPGHPLYMHTFYFMFELLPATVERILVMDSDMIVKGSLAEFYEMDFGDAYAISTNGDCIWEDVIDWKGSFAKLNTTYFSTVNVLFHATAIRRDFSLKDICRADATVNAIFGRSNEEWGFSLLFNGKMKYVSEQQYALYIAHCNVGRFIGCDMEQIIRDAAVIHYFQNHPWDTVYGSLQTYWWKYAKASPYYEEFLRQAKAEALKNHRIDIYRSGAEEFLLDTFQNTFAEHKGKKILLYGMGWKTESLLKSLADWHFVGLTDESAGFLWGDTLFDHKLMKKEEIKDQVEMIIVVARSCYYEEIAERIRNDAILNKYPVYYLDGRRIC